MFGSHDPDPPDTEQGQLTDPRQPCRHGRWPDEHCPYCEDTADDIRGPSPLEEPDAGERTPFWIQKARDQLHKNDKED